MRKATTTTQLIEILKNFEEVYGPGEVLDAISHTKELLKEDCKDLFYLCIWPFNSENIECISIPAVDGETLRASYIEEHQDAEE